MSKLADESKNITATLYYRYGLGFISCFLFLFTTNCQKVDFTTIDSTEKASLLQKEGIFADNAPSGNDGPGSSNPSGSDGDGTSSSNPSGSDGDGTSSSNPSGSDGDGSGSPPGDDGGGTSTLKVPMKRLCRDYGYRDIGSSVAHAKKLKVILSIFESDEDIDKQIISTNGDLPKFSASCVLENQNIRDQIIEAGDSDNYTASSNSNGVTLDLASCKDILAATPSLTDRYVHVNILDADGDISLLYYYRRNTRYNRRSTNASGAYRQQLWAGVTKLNLSGGLYTASSEIQVLFSNKKHMDELCDEKLSSPLVVQVRPDEGTENDAIYLTSIEDGISFDILGENSTPVPYAKKRIGWFSSSKQARQYRFLVKPTRRQMKNYKRGHSFQLGIDQMFGNNTRNQDGSFSDNGYDSLALYDISGSSPMESDGYITQADPVFGQLWLWADMNLNGKVDRRELRSLYRMGLVSIDLDFDPNYKETDSYGNTTTLKSVVLFKDGSLRLIFDLWFVYRD